MNWYCFEGKCPLSYHLCICFILFDHTKRLMQSFIIKYYITDFCHKLSFILQNIWLRGKLITVCLIWFCYLMVDINNSWHSETELVFICHCFTKSCNPGHNPSQFTSPSKQQERLDSDTRQITFWNLSFSIRLGLVIWFDETFSICFNLSWLWLRYSVL